MKLSIALLFVLSFIGVLFVGCEQKTKQENIELRKKVNQLQIENDSLKSVLSDFQQIDNYYYQLSISSRQSKNYEKSNEYLKEMFERFPKSNLTIKAKTLIKKNNEDMARILYEKAISDQRIHLYDYSDEYAQELITKFPKTSFVSKAKKLKTENKKKKKQWERTQLKKGYDLELLTWSWSITSGGSYVKAEGQIKNISNRSLENIMAVAIFYDKNGNFITSADALIDFDPLLSGQKSPFSVHARYNPAIKKATIEFKSLMGGTISAYYK